MYSLFVGGMCIEDVGRLRASEPVRRIRGAVRIPDPTIAGDFLRRFDAESLDALDEATAVGQDVDAYQAEWLRCAPAVAPAYQVWNRRMAGLERSVDGVLGKLGQRLFAFPFDVGVEVGVVEEGIVRQSRNT